MLLQHFDMAMYASSYGQFQLMIKLPADLMDFSALRAYDIEGEGDYFTCVSVERHAQSVLIDLDYSWEEYGDWLEAEGLLDGMLPLRAQLLKGDHRLLYLAWLHIATNELDEETEWEEPPVPPGLANLAPALEAFMDYWQIDDAMVAAAARKSSAAQQGENLAQYLPQLSEEEKDGFLRALLDEDGPTGIRLQRKLKSMSSSPSSPSGPPGRSLEELRAAQAEEQNRLDEEARKEAERRHREKMEQVGKQQTQLWREIAENAELQTARGYDHATELLVDLRDYGDFSGEKHAFQNKLLKVINDYGRSQAFMRRLKERGMA